MASAAATTGREQQRQTATAKARTPDLSQFYRYNAPALIPGNFHFLLDLLRPKLAPFRLRTVDSFGWADEQSVMTGNLSAYRPDRADPSTLPIARGDLIRCRVEWNANRYELWTMRCGAPQMQVDTGQLQVTLQDDLALLDGSARDWFFRKTKGRPFGYRSDEITVAVCQALGVRPGTIARGTQRFALSKRNSSGLDVIKAAWNQEKSAAGGSWVIRLRNGRLDVVPLRRNPLLYVLSKQIRTALLTQKDGATVPTTVLEGTGHVGSGKNARKVTYTVHDRTIVATFGYVHKTKDYGRVDSLGALRDQVKRDYAAGIRLNDTATVSHQGIPFIERGDGIELDLPSEGYKGAQAFVYATRCNHTVQAGVYTSDWDFTATDPFLAVQQADTKAAAQRASKRQQRKRTTMSQVPAHG